MEEIPLHFLLKCVAVMAQKEVMETAAVTEGLAAEILVMRVLPTAAVEQTLVTGKALPQKNLLSRQVNYTLRAVAVFPRQMDGRTPAMAAAEALTKILLTAQNPAVALVVQVLW